MDGKADNKETLLERNKDLRIKPGFCCFGITDSCFLRCKMCQKWKPDIAIKPQDSAPSIPQWKEAIRSLRSITDEGFLINFGGGEPLLMEGLLDLVSFASSLGFKTNIATNAYLIDQVMAKKIAAAGLSSVNISLDSMNSATHDYLRGKEGVWERAVKAIDYLDKYTCKEFEIIICCAIYGVNVREVAGVAEWVNRHPRLRWVYFMAAMQPNNTKSSRDWYKQEFAYLWPEDTTEAIITLDQLIGMKKRGYKINNQLCQLEAFKQYFSYPDKFVKKTSCNLESAVHISSVGNVHICYDWPDLGNIKNDDLREIWYSPKADEVRRNILSCKKNCHHLINCFFEGDYPFKIV